MPLRSLEPLGMILANYNLVASRPKLRRLHCNPSAQSLLTSLSPTDLSRTSLSRSALRKESLTRESGLGIPKESFPKYNEATTAHPSKLLHFGTRRFLCFNPRPVQEYDNEMQHGVFS